MNGVDMRRKSISAAAQIGLLIFGSVLLVSILYAQDKSDRSNWTWNNSDGPQKIEVKVENKVDFNEDYSDVAAIPFDGALRIYDSRGSHAMRLVITAAPNGELRRDYWVDGQAMAFDAQARTWLRGVLLEAVRQGLDAKTRVERILRKSGTRGLIAEIAFLKGDYPRRIYFEALLQTKDVTNQDLKTALRNASTSITGDYERAQLLIHVAGPILAKRELTADFFEAAGKIDSAYEHGRVLAAVLKGDELGKDVLSQLAQSAIAIKSDYEKAQFLIKGAENYQGDTALRTQWLNAVRTIGSDYEHHRTLTSALKANEISADALADLVASAAGIQTDYEKASFLLEAMKHYRSDARLRTAFMETARTISSEYERGRVQKSFDRANF
jgi:ribosomal protein L12E/L44/L45/RPP1/RPP2